MLAYRLRNTWFAGRATSLVAGIGGAGSSSTRMVGDSPTASERSARRARRYRHGDPGLARTSSHRRPLRASLPDVDSLYRVQLFAAPSLQSTGRNPWDAARESRFR